MNARYGSISDGAHRLRRHRHAGLGQHPAHRAVMHAQLRGEGADRPVLGVMQAQDLGFERARDHRRDSRSRSAAQRTEPGEPRQRPVAETAARRSGERCERPARGRCQ